jgi:protoheme IX farnesyltransferase
MSLVEDRGLSGGAVWTGSASVGDYFTLLKPRVMSLVIFTAFAGMVLAPGGIHPVLGLVALIAIAVGAGASGALNMWYDADIDRVMSRTAKRPIPGGRIAPEQAFQFGMVLAVFSVIVLGVAVNWASAAFLAFTIFFYVVVYTMWLKRWTPQNIVIGGAAGAFPPMIGWMAATGTVSFESFVLFLIIFIWTPPHFWALAILKTEDYARAGVPMMPVVAGVASTRRQIVAYSVALAFTGVAPYALGYSGAVYGIAAALLGAVFVALSVNVLRSTEGSEARTAAVRLFVFSMIYLFAIFGLLIVDRVATLSLGIGA